MAGTGEVEKTFRRQEGHQQKPQRWRITIHAARQSQQCHKQQSGHHDRCPKDIVQQHIDRREQPIPGGAGINLHALAKVPDGAIAGLQLREAAEGDVLILVQPEVLGKDNQR